MSTDAALLVDLERYYDAVPRDSASVEEIGPFTLFVRASQDGWPFYARPTLGCSGPFTAEDVRRVRDRQRALDAPETFEWVHETTPALTAVMVGSGLKVARHPLMVLTGDMDSGPGHPGVRLLLPDSTEVGAVNAAIGAAFAEHDSPAGPQPEADVRRRMRRGTFRLVGAFDDAGPAVGGGSHSPRGSVTELTGIAVLPRGRRRGVGAAITAALVADARELGATRVFLSAGSQRVAGIYARVGFQTVATACVADAAS